MLRGIDVVLYEKHQTGEDAFHAPVYEETPVTVHNVLVGAPDTAAIVNELTLTGRRLASTLALPKGDAHDGGAEHQPQRRRKRLGRIEPVAVPRENALVRIVAERHSPAAASGIP